jgi:aspartyl/glutamyl-tRNA(Asn/Gln) amidotransferase C subunit
MTAKVTVKDVERVAELAHLELKPEETPLMLNDLNAILDYVAELNELDTAGVEPLAQVSELVDTAGARAHCATTCRCPRWIALRSPLPSAGDRSGLLQGAQGD